MRILLIPLIALLGFGAGCSHRPAHGAMATTSSTSGTGTSFLDRRNGFGVTYPTDWKPRKDEDAQNVLTMDPDGKAGGAELTIAVPNLPPHIPGVIPLPSVEKGYIDDVKKRMKDVKVLQSVPTKVQGAFARRFVISGRDKTGQRKLEVLAIVKGDHLYIMTAEASIDDFPAAHAAFEAVSTSWKWIEK